MTDDNQTLAAGSKLDRQFRALQPGAPVFIVGCPRSGTSYLYRLLLSAGGFAEFHTQMNVYDVLEPIYGDLSVLRNKRAALDEWLRSKAGRISGLERPQIEQNILHECQGAGDFLRVIMSAIARKQGVTRWIDSTPTNAPHMLRIHRDFPDALFLHIIRDPRDVALSLDKRGWSRPLPWDQKKGLLAAGLYWEWIVRKGRHLGSVLPKQYMEVRYEDLVQRPEETFHGVVRFIGGEPDSDRAKITSIGSAKEALTSFPEDIRRGAFAPVGRWRERFPADQLRDFEILIGRYMEELGYQPSLSEPDRVANSRHRAMRLMYRLFYPFKQWAKTHTPLSRWMVDYSEILIDK